MQRAGLFEIHQQNMADTGIGSEIQGESESGSLQYGVISMLLGYPFAFIFDVSKMMTFSNFVESPWMLIITCFENLADLA